MEVLTSRLNGGEMVLEVLEAKERKITLASDDPAGNSYAQSIFRTKIQII